MAEYIKREEAVNALAKIINESDMPEDWNRRMSTAMSALFRIPAADVRPVKRGVWRKLLQNNDGTSDYECSACAGLIVDVPDDDLHPLCSYCPNCGADMREVDDLVEVQGECDGDSCPIHFANEPKYDPNEFFSAEKGGNHA